MPTTPDYVERNNQAAARYAMQQQLPSYNFNNPINPYYATSGGWYGPPVAGGPQMLPAVQASGAHYSAPGSREGWIEQGVPPVIYQRSPYATAAFRVTPNPWGGASVAPLVGFPSRYPHVVSGVPMQPGSLAMSVAAPYIMRPPAPTRRPAAPARRPAGDGNKQQNNQQNNQQNTPPATPPPVTPGPLSDVDVPNPQGTYMGLSIGDSSVSATGHFPSDTPGVDLYTDPDVNMTTRNTRFGTREGGALAIEGLNDIVNRYLNTGISAEYRPRVNYADMTGQQLTNDRTGYGARIYAETQGADRNAQYYDLQQRAAQAAAYNEALRQQRGY